LRKASHRRYILIVPRRVSTILPVEEIAEENSLVRTILHTPVLKEMMPMTSSRLTVAIITKLIFIVK